MSSSFHLVLLRLLILFPALLTVIPSKWQYCPTKFPTNRSSCSMSVMTGIPSIASADSISECSLPPSTPATSLTESLPSLESLPTIQVNIIRRGNFISNLLLASSASSHGVFCSGCSSDWDANSILVSHCHISPITCYLLPRNRTLTAVTPANIETFSSWSSVPNFFEEAPPSRSWWCGC